MQRLGVLWSLAYIDPSTTQLPKVQEASRRRGRKIVRSRQDGRHQGNKTFRAQQDLNTHELLESMAAYTGPASQMGFQH